MKAVVVEIKGRHVAALANDGCVSKIRNSNYTVGQVIELKKQAARKPAKIVAWASSAAAAIVLVSAAAWAYFTPYTYVSIDVNPSIEYSVNRFDRVLSVSAVDSDGTEILKNLDLNNKTIDEAIKDTIDKIKKAGYFEGTDPGGIEIATSSDNQQKSENLAKELKTTAMQETEGTASPVEVDAISVTHQRVLDAKALGTTPGKLNLVQKLQASVADPNSIDVKEWLNKPVKTILKAIKENKKIAGNNNNTDKKKESNSSSSSEASKAKSKAAGSVQQSQKPSDKSSKSQNSTKSNGNSSGTSKVTGNENKGNFGTDGNSNENSQITSASDTTSSESTQLQTSEGTNSSANNGNQGNSKSNKGNGNQNTKSK